MKRIITIALFAVALGIGAYTNAQDFDIEKSKVGGGIVPGSFWYRYDLFYEEAWQDVLGIFSRKAQLSYIEKRIKEREAEAWEMVVTTKSALSDEAIRALGLKQDYRAKAKAIAVSGEDDERIKAIETNGLRFDAEYGKYVAKELEDVASAKKQVRDEIAAARKAGNAGELIDLAKRANEAQQKENDLFARNAQYVGTSEMISELLENTVTGAAKAELILQRAARTEESKKATDAAWKKLLADLDAAKDAQSDAEAKVLDTLTKNLQQLIHKIEVANNQKVLAERKKQDLKDIKAAAPQEAKKPVAPPPAPKPKPALEKIPSESAEQYPLTIVGNFGGLNGEVNKFFTAQFSAEGGLPPYHFQLGTGGGFPPQGVILDASGQISGTPRIAGRYTFDACVVDTVGKSDCETFAMVVEPPVQEAPPPPQEPEVELQLTLTSRACVKDDRGRGWVEIAGTASGPVDASVAVAGDLPSAECGAWSPYHNNSCFRPKGQPGQTQWKFRVWGYGKDPQYFGYVKICKIKDWQCVQKIEVRFDPMCQ